MKLLLAPIVFLSSCLTVPTCLPEDQEKVSVCRAEVACGKGKFMTGFAFMLGGFGAAKSGRNSAVDTYNDCVDRNLSAQKTNAGVADSTQRCVSTKVSDDKVETVCH